MPTISFAKRSTKASVGENLLDVLNKAGANVAFNCRAGSCHTCLVRCAEGSVLQHAPLAYEQQEQGWCLACQSEVIEDARFEVFDPKTNAVAATLTELDWLSSAVAKVRLMPERTIRYTAGQSTVVWLDGVARPYSIASYAEPWLEFHISCAHQGAFVSKLKQAKVGESLFISPLRTGGLFYDPNWQDQPLYLIAQGTGLAPLWGILQQALAMDHRGTIEFWHFADEHYLKESLNALAARYPNLHLRYLSAARIEQDLQALTLVSRHAHALLCGHQISVELMAKRFYLAGLPRSHLHTERFIVTTE